MQLHVFNSSNVMFLISKVHEDQFMKFERCSCAGSVLWSRLCLCLFCVKIQTKCRLSSHHREVRWALWILYLF